jgi:hypothetical protein
MLSLFSSGRAQVVQSHHRGIECANCVNGKEILAQLSDCQPQGKLELCQCTCLLNLLHQASFKLLFTLLAELQEQAISKATISRLMNNQVSVFTAFSPTFLHSLANHQCSNNKPLYVFPYGERMARNSLIQVSFKLRKNYNKNLFQISTSLAIKLGV